jgi:uncharacterized protein (DUF952 family)
MTLNGRTPRRWGRYDESEVDRRDNFIHFSTAAQVHETARRHFVGRKIWCSWP